MRRYVMKNLRLHPPRHQEMHVVVLGRRALGKIAHQAGDGVWVVGIKNIDSVEVGEGLPGFFEGLDGGDLEEKV